MVFESGRRAPPPLLAQWGLIDGSGGLDNLTSGIFDGVDSVDELALGQPDGGRAGARVAAAVRGRAAEERGMCAEAAHHRRACPRRVRVL